jgi:hypothetical protein
MERKRLSTTIVKSAKRRGRKKTIEKGVDLSMMETALRASNGLITKAASMINVPIPTLQHYIRKHPCLRDALFETRSMIVDEAEESLRSLVKDKNLTAVIFTLKCLAQDRGYIDVPQKNLNQQAPIIINLMPASPDVKLPKAQVIKGGKSKTLEGMDQSRGKLLAITGGKKEVDEEEIPYIDDDMDSKEYQKRVKEQKKLSRVIEVESEAVDG